jgi:glycosyltransferase involved in cell wall biosynthesis
MDFECILVDDCSTDSSPAICDDYLKKDSRIKVIHNTQNKGCPQSRKVGFEKTSGDYILFVDSDDWVEKNMLEVMYKKAINESLNIVYCGIYRNSDTEQYEYDSPILENKTEMIKQIVTWGKFSPSVWNKLVKRNLYERVIFPTANHGEDRQISIQLIHYAKSIGYVKDLLYHYYENFNSLENNNSMILQRYIDEYEIAIFAIRFLYDNYGNCFNIFEPELSNYINSLKLHFIREKAIRNSSKLHELYPASNDRIFNNSWNEGLCNKIFLFLSSKHLDLPVYFVIVYFLMDTYNTLKNSVKSAYRIIVPRKIRSFIWEQRHHSRS